MWFSAMKKDQTLALKFSLLSVTFSCIIGKQQMLPLELDQHL